MWKQKENVAIQSVSLSKSLAKTGKVSLVIGASKAMTAMNTRVEMKVTYLRQMELTLSWETTIILRRSQSTPKRRSKMRQRSQSKLIWAIDTSLPTKKNKSMPLSPNN